MWEWAKCFKTVMLQMEPLFVCFYVREVLPCDIRAVDCLVLERKVMLMEMFTWTRYYILHPSESSESSGVSFDSGSLKALSSPVGWDYDKINMTESPSCCCSHLFCPEGLRLSSSPAWYSPAAFTDLRPIRAAAPELLASAMPLQSTAFHFCGRTVSYSPGSCLQKEGKTLWFCVMEKKLVIDLWNHLKLGKEYFQL